MTGELKDVPPIIYWNVSYDIVYDTVKKFFQSIPKKKADLSWELKKSFSISRMLRNPQYFLR